MSILKNYVQISKVNVLVLVGHQMWAVGRPGTVG